MQCITKNAHEYEILDQTVCMYMLLDNATYAIYIITTYRKYTNTIRLIGLQQNMHP